MLYLAEIQKHNKSFLGGVETKLKLIACQRNDQSWSLVTNESITTEEANDFGDGALVVLNLGTNRQLQGKIELASQKIIGVLKNFSRLIEKNQEQEQEINQWKESLAIQSEELSRRQIEMETRLEHVEQMEEEFKQFEQQRSEIALAKAESEKIRAEFETKTAELEGAWSQLRGQQRNIDEQLKQAKVLDPTQVAAIKQQIATISNTIAVANALQEQLDVAESAAKEQQAVLQSHWDNLNLNSQEIISKKEALEKVTAEITDSKKQINSLQDSIVEAEQQLAIEQKSLEVKQELTQFLNVQSEAQKSMLQMLAASELDADGISKANIDELENMPLPSLEETVETLKKDLEKVARFVNDQEEELDWQCKAVEGLEAKIAEVNDFERLTLEQELADEKEAKKMLDQTLVGQRRSLKERHQVLLEHSRVLKRRQGIVDFDFESAIQDIDLTPIKQGLEKQQQKLESQQQDLSEAVAQIEEGIQRLRSNLEQHKTQKSQLELAMNQQQDSWHDLNLQIVQMQSQISFYEQQLQPIQDNLDTINHQIEAMRELMTNQAENNPSDALKQVEQVIDELAVA
ncbi:MAG: pilus motility taxis protein HmpF [Cyanobacteria bacterium P01_E01_bin.35]